MDESTKTKAVWGEYEFNIIKGKGIDIGCGTDPITEDVIKFDMDSGDANDIIKSVNEQYDYVYSSHCLEHMVDPRKSLKEWWALVKPGGHLILIVPDEDLYEQGYWPSLFNPDHKATFTISKQKSWSPCSHNILDVIKDLEHAVLVNVKLLDRHYKRRLLNHGRYSWRLAFCSVRASYILQKRLNNIGFNIKMVLDFFMCILGLPVDQTTGRAMAQIQLIVKKE